MKKASPRIRTVAWHCQTCRCKGTAQIATDMNEWHAIPILEAQSAYRLIEGMHHAQNIKRCKGLPMVRIMPEPLNFLARLLRARRNWQKRKDAKRASLAKKAKVRLCSR